MEIYFRIYVIFGKKNQRKMVPEVATRQQGATRGVAALCCLVTPSNVGWGPSFPVRKIISG